MHRSRHTTHRHQVSRTVLLAEGRRNLVEGFEYQIHVEHREKAEVKTRKRLVGCSAIRSSMSSKEVDSADAPGQILGRVEMDQKTRVGAVEVAGTIMVRW